MVTTMNENEELDPDRDDDALEEDDAFDDEGSDDSAEMTADELSAAGVMTKAELVDEVARVVQLTKKQAETIVNIVFDSIVDSLRAGQKIELRGFGSFRLRSRKSRTGRNPKTGEKVEVPSKKIPYFKPGKELKELINKAMAEESGTGEAGETLATE
jgi:integration host factor subunit beta